jgi:hypothetical protein
MNQARLDLVIQYALAVADNDLAAIHLIKYVYLADLAYARTHGGETFTGTSWVFLHYGPYSKEVHDRIPDAAKGAGAEIREKRRSEDDKDYISYKGSDEQRAEKLRDQLPPEVASAVRWTVTDHGADTSALLDEVYRTQPMLSAAPGESLDFTAESSEPTQASPRSLMQESISAAKPAWKIRKEDRAARERITAEVQRRLAAKRASKGPATGPSPRYDSLYRDGVKALDSLAGEAVPQGEGEATFADSVWKSPSRRDPDASE